MRNPLLAAAWCIAAAVPVLNVAALAQSTPPPPTERPNPLNAEAAVPPAEYRSALTGYRPLGDEKIMPWGEANDIVGGVYAKQAQQADPAAPAKAIRSPGTPPTAPGAMKPMPGHKMN